MDVVDGALRPIDLGLSVMAWAVDMAGATCRQLLICRGRRVDGLGTASDDEDVVDVVWYSIGDRK